MGNYRKSIGVFSFVIVSIITSLSKAQVWEPLGHGFDSIPGMFTLTSYNGQLIAGGQCQFSNGVRINGLAIWDGVNWNSINRGPQGSVFAFCEFNGELIAGGSFEVMDSVPFTSRIARWNGTSWSPLGYGITSHFDDIYSLAFYNGKLYAGGDFTQIDSLNIRDLDVWDGISWDSVWTIAVAFNRVESMVVYNNELIVGGWFGWVDSIPGTSFIAKFDGTNWSSVGGGVSNYVKELFVDTVNNRLYATGNFSYAGGGTVPCPSHTAYWDGNSWTAVGNLPIYPETICVFNNEVYSGVIYNWVNQNGDTLHGIARWDGNYWQPVAGGLIWNDTISGGCHGMFVYQNRLIVAGGFSKAGDTTARMIAAWGNSTTGTNEPIETSAKVVITPNPFVNSTNVFIPEAWLEKRLLIFVLSGADGRELFRRKIVSNKFEITGFKYQRGVYFYAIYDRRRKLYSGKVIAGE